MTDEKRLLPTVIYAVVCCDDGFLLRATDDLQKATFVLGRGPSPREIIEYVPRASVCEPKSEFRVPVRSKSEFKRVEALGGNPVFAQPAPSPIDDVGRIGVPSVLVVASKLLECAESWEPECRLVGNVRADEIVSLCRAVLGITRGEDGKHG